MLISKKISEYIIFENESILKALEKINKNKNRIVFVVGEDGVLCGAISDGDFRRWVTSTSDFDLNQPSLSITNSKILYENIKTPRGEIEKHFSSDVTILPLVDDYKRVSALAFSTKKGISIGERTITQTSGTYIIAEIGNNHNGDINLAKRLVDLAIGSGVDCVKFQMRDMNSLYKNGTENDASADLGAQYTHDLLKRFQLSNEELIEVFDYCKSCGLTPLCTPWDLKSLEILEEYGMEAYKVASADFTNHELLEALANTGKPLICSTGMCTESEIKKSSDYLKSKGVEAIILHCNSTYPTPFKDVNLSYIPRLRKVTDFLVGYSGHERGISVPIAAVALGAVVVEKHFTIDKTMEGNDHKVSLLPEEFKEMVTKIREVEESMGKSTEREISQGEMINREVLAKSLVSTIDLEVETIVTRDMVEVKSPGQGLQPCYLDTLIGKKIKREVKKGDYFYESDLDDELVEAKNYQFSRPFGIPVRYHDYKNLSSKSNVDFVEFHLSYQDLDLKIDNFFKDEQLIDFAIHSPELFAGDHILDLASEDEFYLSQSVDNLNRVCEETRKLKKYFPKTLKPVIVVNAGGFSKDGFVEASQKTEMYKRIAKNLEKINQEGVELIIQTMPPFPWHFGGQSYHNLFVSADEIAEFCESYNYRICFDISHTMMACNYYHWELSAFTKRIAAFIAHMHVVDAKGIDGEGVQIGRGDVNFSRLSSDLNTHAPEKMFIPEVWQGHKNDGEGFWKALNFLEDYL